jgi:ornithine decarboxylase
MAGLARYVDARGVTLIAEPGRYLVADAGVIEAEVVLVAERGDGRWVYLDVGLFGGLAEALDESIQYRIEAPDNDGPVGRVVLAGPTCDSVDVLYRHAGYTLPLSIAAGDRVRLLATGAYTASYSSVGFNGLPPLATEVGRGWPISAPAPEPTTDTRVPQLA